MIDHVNTQHQVNAQKEVLNFPNEKQFKEWKEKEELRTFVDYSKQRGDGESKMIIHKHFVCQHDGKAKTHRKAAEPVRKTSQKFSSQPLSISAHSHSVNLANTIYQPIPSTTRQEIKAELSIGIPVNEVYKELHEGTGNRESRVENLSITRAYLISRAHVSDIKRRIKYSRGLHHEESTLTYLIVKKLQLESYNCIIVYKPQGQPVQTGLSMYDDTDAKRNLFVLGLQAKE